MPQVIDGRTYHDDGVVIEIDQNYFRVAGGATQLIFLGGRNEGRWFVGETFNYIYASRLTRIDTFPAVVGCACPRHEGKFVVHNA